MQVKTNYLCLSKAAANLSTRFKPIVAWIEYTEVCNFAPMESWISDAFKHNMQYSTIIKYCIHCCRECGHLSNKATSCRYHQFIMQQLQNFRKGVHDCIYSMSSMSQMQEQKLLMQLLLIRDSTFPNQRIWTTYMLFFVWVPIIMNWMKHLVLLKCQPDDHFRWY